MKNNRIIMKSIKKREVNVFQIKRRKRKNETINQIY